MQFLTTFTLLAWIPCVVILFMTLPPRRAVVVAFLTAWLFLPMAGWKVPSLPDYTKMSATTVGVLIGAALFDAERLLSFRPKWVDLPIFLFCTSPAMSSYVNDLGLYDAASEVVRQAITWGLPYLIGRIYFNDLEGLRELAIALFVGGLVYVPLCWLEVRLSPQLHFWVYGKHQHAFIQHVRDGGYRPMVFMQHGLMVGMWMGMTSLVGIWLWKSKTIRQIWDIPMYVLVPCMLFTVYLCKSKYAVLLLMTGVTALFMARALKTKWIVLLLLMVPVCYTYARANGLVTGETMIETAESLFGEERAKSVAVRINNENALAVKAMEHPWFGWGGWGDARVKDDITGKELVTDSLWIIHLGKYGWVGLLGLIATMLLPMVLVCFDWRMELWTHPAVAPIVVLGMMTSLYMFDHLMNAMVNPIFMLTLGAVASAHYAVPQVTQRSMPQHARRPMYRQPVAPANFRPA
jgi:hypothetical protein